MLGIESLKKAAKAAVKFGVKLEDYLDDKKLSFMEGVNLAISTAPDAFALVQDASNIKAEYLDLVDSERQELVDYVVAELDLENDQIEEVVEKAFDFLVSIDELVQAIKALRED